ncbi:hypothetical protein K502DRAFT_347851 [Neoconidiobolus thromboides FSU 785]|nr:hypothetical protein K502DRAFT_347851 [Neoconidiobolus thromboides FSU 785]
MLAEAHGYLNNSNTFKLKGLSESNLRFILSHFSLYQQSLFLRVCKEWRSLLLPLVWESTDIGLSFKMQKQKLKTIKKYGHFIKHLTTDIYGYPALNSFKHPNLKSISATLHTYLLAIHSKFDLSLHHLTYQFYIQRIPTKTFLFQNNIDLAQIFHSLKSITLPEVNSGPVLEVINLLPPTLSSVALTDSGYQLPYFEKVFCKVPKLKHLRLGFKLYTFENFLYLQSNLFEDLESLTFKGFMVRGFDELYFELENFPKLNRIECIYCTPLILVGSSKITSLYFLGMNINYIELSDSSFQYLRKLTLIECFNLTSQQLYSILKLPNLTYLHLESKCSNYVLLLDSIYPTSKSSIITLELTGFVLGAAFFKFILNSCYLLQKLSLFDCSLENNINGLYLTLGPKLRLKLGSMVFRLIDCDTELSKLQNNLFLR